MVVKVVVLVLTWHFSLFGPPECRCYLHSLVANNGSLKAHSTKFIQLFKIKFFMSSAMSQKLQSIYYMFSCKGEGSELIKLTSISDRNQLSDD